VSIEYIRGMSALGYERLPLDTLVRLRSHDVQPKFAQALQGLGYSRLGVEELVDLRSHDVQPQAVELPGARPQPWIVSKPGTPEGRVETFRVRSETQNLERPFLIYTPPAYRADGPPNALLVLFDGPSYTTPELPMPTVVNNLIAASKIPSTVAVLVANVGDRRVQDLSANPEFSDFVAKELIPWVRARYNVTTDPAQTVVGGYSLGGLAAAHVGLRHFNIFGNVLSQSGSFWWTPDYTGSATDEQNWMAKQFLSTPKLPLKFYLDAGTFEAPRGPEVIRILVSARHLRDVLLAKGYEVHYQQFAGGHDPLSWRGTLADGLIALLGNNPALTSAQSDVPASGERKGSRPCHGR